MRPILAFIVIMLSVGVATTARADQTPQNDGASQLGVQTVSNQRTTGTNAEQLHGLARQVNQNVSNNSNPNHTHTTASLQSLLNLPKGMVIRGSQSGGLTVGTEF